jgi:sec-independent protein translocase protein TatB
MFGMGFAEILIIGIIAILFLGPDKLPQTMVEIAKFFRNVKRTVASAKESLEEELHISDIKDEALNYKKQLTEASAELDRMADLDGIKSEVSEAKNEAKVEAPKPKAPAAPVQPEVVTFAKKPKKAPEKPAEAPKSEDT